MQGSRRLVLAAAAAAAAALAGLAAAAGSTSAVALPPQGVYESCAPGQSACLEHLDRFAAAGFRLVVNYDQLDGTLADELAYAARARADGLQVIWDLSSAGFWKGSQVWRVYAGLAASCGARSNDALVACYVRAVRGLPATWGYYTGDEVPPRGVARARALAVLVHALDPVHPRLYVGIGSTSARAEARYLDPFAAVADVAGADHYPVSTAAAVSTVGDVARNVQSLADAHGQRPVLVLQSFSWGEYPDATWVCSPFPGCTRYPSEAEMRQMRDLALASARPALVLWYSDFDIRRSDDPAGHWADLVQAALGP